MTTDFSILNPPQFCWRCRSEINLERGDQSAGLNSLPICDECLTFDEDENWGTFEITIVFNTDYDDSFEHYADEIREFVKTLNVQNYKVTAREFTVQVKFEIEALSAIWATTRASTLIDGVFHTGFLEYDLPIFFSGLTIDVKTKKRDDDENVD